MLKVVVTNEVICLGVGSRLDGGDNVL